MNGLTLKILGLLLTLLFVSLQILLWFSNGGWFSVRSMRAEVAQLEAQNNTQTLANKALQSEVEDLQHGHSAIEEEARYRLNLINKGEIFVQVLNPEEQSGKAIEHSGTIRLLGAPPK